jgi:hypothetical protein
MTERFYEITCDVCGETAHVTPDETLAEFFSPDRVFRWRRKKDLAICQVCWNDGSRWPDATLHQTTRS